MLAHMQVVIIACLRACSGGHRMLVLTNARACSGGSRVRACEHARAVAVIECKYAQVVFIAGNVIHRARVQYRARLRTCSGSHRMLAHM